MMQDTRCCIAGGGPAGVMLGLLLARAGVPVVVLEKHQDFLRDFRGDTIHPSTLELMHELGFLDELLALPHQEVRALAGQVGPDRLRIADFDRLPIRCPFIALMPQWDFLDFLVRKAKAYPTFRIEMESEVTDVLMDGGRIAGVCGKSPRGDFEVTADLTVGADGRSSVVRSRAGLVVKDLGAPMDVLWMRLPREPSDGEQTFGHVEAGRMLVMLNREDYWQCAYVVAKGEAERVRARGIEWLRADLARIEPFLAGRVEELGSWEKDVHLLTVKVDRLEKWWRPGLLCIGDAAHAMSPIGGVGIDLAVQDAVAAANILTPSLLRGAPPDDALARVEERRMLPTRATQRVQVLVQRRVVARALCATEPIHAPLALRILTASSLFRALPALLVGVGVRPEHVETVEA